METFRLKSMVDFVLETTEQKLFKYNTIQIRDYSNFLKQPLKLEMFVPCDKDGNILENPNNDKFIHENSYEDYLKSDEKYQQAKEKVLFEGFEFTESQKYSVNNHIKLSVSPYGLNNEKLILTKLNEENKFHTWLQLNTIEDLTQCNINLTPNAIKQLGL